MTIVVERCEKLGLNKPAYALALRIYADMIEKGFFLWGPNWEANSIVAINPDGTCAGLLLYSFDENVDYADVDVTCIDPKYRSSGVLIMLLAKFRDVCKEKSIDKVRFLYHPDNPHMKDAARIMGGRIRSVTAEVNLKDLLDV